MIRRPPRPTLFPPHAALPFFRLGGRGSRLAPAAARRIPKSGHRIPENEKRREARRGKQRDRKSTRLNSSHANISYAVFCLKKKKLNSGMPYEYTADVMYGTSK